MSSCKLFSVIVPARNEESQIAKTLEAIVKAIARFEEKDCRTLDISASRVELIVVDNNSTDNTGKIIDYFVRKHRVHSLGYSRLKAPCARNYGAKKSNGKVILFVDADTWIPEDSLLRINDLVNKQGYKAGIFRLESQKRNIRSWFWWTFWNHVRRLPLAKAKALPAFMYCTKATFDTYGPFDEDVVIGEEWPILAGLYCEKPNHFVYDQTLTARTSCRRMELQSFGYIKTFLKYVWAILHHKGRIKYSDQIREKQKEVS
jgi:glycosyltransferase involved in cell wall biosynthesis